MKRLLLPLALVALVGAGCATMAPRSFNRGVEPGWSSIEIRQNIDYDEAWTTVFNLLCRTFDIDKAIKEEGYIRTSWLLSWSGQYTPGYMVRITIKFSDDRKKLDVKSEALLMQGARGVIGVDTRLASTLKTDLMGTIGRTTR